MIAHHLRVASLALCFSVAGLGAADADRGKKGKKQKNQRATKYHGAHPLSVSVDDGFCYIEVPHVHGSSLPGKHKSLYRDHHAHHSFIADPVAYGYDGPRHSYYGHHPVAVEVLLGESESYASGQQLEYCYLDGPHYHLFEPAAGLSFEVKGGASWYIGEFPEAYVVGKVQFAPVNRVYATVEVERPEVVFDAPPVGYLGPIVDIHVHAPGAALVVEPGHVDVHGHGHGHGHAEIRAGIEVHIPTPSLEIDIGLPGVVVHDGHRGRRHKKHKHPKYKSKGHKKHKHKRRKRPHW